MSGCSGSEPFALRVIGDSMEPEFSDGEILIVEPGGIMEDGSFVIAQQDDEFIFRQLRSREDQWYLLPLNDRYPDVQLHDKGNIKGTIVSKSSGKGRQVKSYL